MTFMIRVSNSLARTVKAVVARGIYAHQEYLWASTCLSSAQLFGQVCLRGGTCLRWAVVRWQADS